MKIKLKIAGVIQRRRGRRGLLSSKEIRAT
jgi:hypothetical protein